MSYPPAKHIGFLSVCRLIEASQKGDVQAMQEVWIAHARLPYSLANVVRVQRDAVADLLQEGQLSLHHCIATYDRHRLCEYSHFAYIAVKRHMLDSRPRLQFRVSIPRSMYRRFCKYFLDQKRSQCAQEASQSWEALFQSNNFAPIISLYALATPIPLDRAVAREAEDPGKALALIDMKSSLLYCLGKLPCRLRSILVLRYGLSGESPVHLETIGITLGLSKAQVSRLQVEAETRLREILIHRGWDDCSPPSALSLTMPGPSTQEASPA